MAERDFSDVMKEALNKIASRLKDFGPELGEELKRLGKQGSMEIANSLYNGSDFVPYGPGAYGEEPEVKKGGQDVEPELQQEHERGGREM